MDSFITEDKRVTEITTTAEKLNALRLIAAITLLIATFFGCRYVEYSMSEPDGAMLTLIIGIGGCIRLLWHFGQGVDKDHQIMISVRLMTVVMGLGSIGWFANAWFNDRFIFHGNEYEPWFVVQDDQFPNQFYFTGDLEIGAASDVTDTILEPEVPTDPAQPIVLQLDSFGGSVQVGILLAELVEQYDIRVEVVGRCGSACGYPLLASNERYIHPRAWIGFHAPYSEYSDGTISFDDNSLTFYYQILVGLLEKIGVSDEFIQSTNLKDAERLWYPSYERLKAEGIVNYFEPTYVEAEPPEGYW